MESKCRVCAQFSRCPCSQNPQSQGEQSVSFPESVSLLALQSACVRVENTHRFILKKVSLKSSPESEKIAVIRCLEEKQRALCRNAPECVHTCHSSFGPFYSLGREWALLEPPIPTPNSSGHRTSWDITAFRRLIPDMVPLAKNLGRTKKQKHNPALLRVREARIPGSTKFMQRTETVATSL